MAASRPIVEQWFARTVEAYPGLSAQFLATEQDPFRNPVGHTLRESLAVLAGELFGAMNAAAIASALDSVLRIRAVQAFTPSEAVGFIFLLKPLVRDLPGHDAGLLERRIDQLALMAFDKYMQCREQLGEIRVNEAKRALGRWQG
jgi:hypothetical protein